MESARAREWVEAASADLTSLGLLVITLGCGLADLRSAPATLGNGLSQLELRPDGVMVLTTPDKARAEFAPAVAVLSSEQNPNLELRWGEFSEPALKGHRTGSIYNVLTWGHSAGRRATKQHVEDGYDPNADRGYGPGRTANLFTAAQTTTLRANASRLAHGRITLDFPATDAVALSATVELPAGATAPVLRLKAKILRDGWYSFGYVGAPITPPNEVVALWQPLINNERRMPEEPFLEAGFRCPLPTTFVMRGNTTVGVVADPSEYPFQPMPSFQNSRFGVAVRNAGGHAQPMLFAPILGGRGSKLAAGAEFTFVFRLHVSAGDIPQAYEQLARTMFGFADVRHNELGSLNETLDNMIEFGLGPHAKFNSDLRGFAYDTDVPGSVKNISALHPLSLALVRDDARIYEQLARPIMEYFLSRERFLFTIDPAVKGQSASSRLGGFGAPLSEFSALYLMSGRRTPAFRHAAESLFGQDRSLNLESTLRGDFWANSLALYRATGERTWLERAVRDADEYLKKRVAQRPADFADPDSRGLFFWPSFVPQWIELYELFEETGERRFLDAAHAGARAYTQYVWLAPAIPAGSVKVNEGGVAPAYREGPKFTPIKIPEETVPAWRVSEIGLTSESSGTSKGARGIFLACYAPWMMRIAAQTGDRFLHDVARSAIIGRYTSFPGYHMNTARTTVYEKSHFAERSKDELNSTTSIHYNHIWPQIALLIDYMTADAFMKSRGAVDFPGRYAEGYGYVQQKVFGDRPGRINGEDGWWLWMPRGVVTADHPEINTLVARRDDALAVILTNQSRQAVRSTLSFDLARVGWSQSGGKVEASAKAGDTAARPLSIVAPGKITVEVAPEGITSVVLRGVRPKAGFQQKVLTASAPLAKTSELVMDFRGLRAFGLSFGPDELTNVYLYLPDLDRAIARCTVRVHEPAGERALTDTAYPFDFSFMPAAGAKVVKFQVEIETKDGKRETSPVTSMALHQGGSLSELRLSR